MPLEGLNAETEFEVYVQGICGEDETTEWMGGYFTTPEPTTVTQTIALAEGTNWVSFYVDITLADLQEALVEAVTVTNPTITIKSQNQNVSYLRGRWFGALTTLVPGQGYIYNSASSEVRTFTYPAGTSKVASKAPYRQRLFFRGLLSESKQQVAEEIPQRGGAHGKHLAEVEVPFQLAVEQIDRHRVDAQAH